MISIAVHIWYYCSMSPNSVVASLLEPFNAIVIEAPKGTYRDFGSSRDYPLKGVTYPVDYGYLPGYMGEDKADLDFFVGEVPGGLSGLIRVLRPDTENGETKFFMAVTEEDIIAICEAFKPVMLECKTFQHNNQLFKAIEVFKLPISLPLAEVDE